MEYHSGCFFKTVEGLEGFCPSSAKPGELKFCMGMPFHMFFGYRQLLLLVYQNGAISTSLLENAICRGIGVLKKKMKRGYRRRVSP